MAFSKANDGYVTFGKVFGSCFRAVMIIALVMVVWNIICIYGFPEMKQKGLEAAREGMAKNPKVTDEQIDKFMQITNKWYNTMVIAGTVFGTLIMGAIFSLIGAAVAKKKGEPPLSIEVKS
jgi:hypothetical protein